MLSKVPFLKKKNEVKEEKEMWFFFLNSEYDFSTLYLP